MRVEGLSAAVALALTIAQAPPAQPAAPSQSPPPRASGQTTTAPVGTGVLSGRVVVTASGQSTPLRRARVTLRSATAAPVQVDTGVDGRYRVEKLVPGSYTVAVDKPGFLPAARLLPITVGAGAAVFDVTMVHAAAIEGRVTTADGEPVPGFAVSAVRLGYGPYGKRPMAIKQAVTDDKGHFRVHTLAAGEYYVEAAPDPTRRLQQPPTGPAALRTYFPGTPRLNDAGVVVVSAGQDTNNIDFTASTAPLSMVMGRVLLASGQPAASFSARLQRVGSPPGETLCVTLRPQPEFYCSAIPPGDYWLLVTARGSATAPPEFAATSITVPAVGLDKLVINTVAAPALSGVVEIEGGGAVPRDLQIAALESEYELPGIAASPGSAPGAGGASALVPGAVAADGTFVLPGVFGPRLIRPARVPDGFALKSVRLGELDITDTPTNFAAPDKTAPLRVVLTPSTGGVSGLVTDRADRPAAGARVIVFSDDTHRWGARSRFIKTIETGSDGRYALTGFLPGIYLAIAVDSLDDGTWEDPDVLATLRGLATRVVVGTEKQSVNLRRTGGGL